MGSCFIGTYVAHIVFYNVNASSQLVCTVYCGVYCDIQCSDRVNGGGLQESWGIHCLNFHSSAAVDTNPNSKAQALLILGWPELYKVPMASDAICPILGLLKEMDCLECCAYPMTVFQCMCMYRFFFQICLGMELMGPMHCIVWF